MASPVCEQIWTNITIIIGVVTLVVLILFTALVTVSSVLTRRQEVINIDFKKTTSKS